MKAAEKLKNKFLDLNKAAKQWQVLNTTEELKKKQERAGNEAILHSEMTHMHTTRLSCESN